MVAFLKALVRLLTAVYQTKKERRRILHDMRRSDEKFEPFRFTLEEMICPICKKRPHKGLTKQLSAGALSRGYMSCEIHGPVIADILLPLPANSEEWPDAA